MSKTYDADYFQRWYRDPALRAQAIGGRARLARKVALAVATAEYHLERPLRTVLDVGCGEGAWRAPLLKLRPDLRYLGFDSSEYAIARHGARRNLHLARFADFAHLRPCAPVDLLICSDVIPYPDPREPEPGLPGPSEPPDGPPFPAPAPPRHGGEGDTEGFRRRPARFYRERFNRVGFVALGSHLWLAPGAADDTAALERGG